MAVLHISQEEAERDFASVLKRLDANTSVVIENGAHVVAKMEAQPKHRTIEEAIAMLPEDSGAYVDDQFAADVLEGIELHREPMDLSIFG